MKKLAIIGASYLQLPLVKKAKEMEIETHCFAWEEGAVCKDIADYFYPVSVVEKDKILTICQSIKVDGITSIASDSTVLTTCYVAEKMGLISNGISGSNTTTNKYLMRQCFTENGLLSPQFFLASDNFLTFDLKYPVIVKPTDRSGSRGIRKVENEADLLMAIECAKKESFTHQAIVEEYVNGLEVSVETISWEGTHYVLAITDKVTTGAPYFVEIEHHQPSQLKREILEKIENEVLKALDALKIQFGACHSEFMITKNVEVYIIEVGARMGGDFIGSDLVQLSTGYDFLEGVIDVSLGRFKEPWVKHVGFSGVYFLTKETPNVLSIIRNKENFKEIVDAQLTNNKLYTVKSSSERSGYFIYNSEKKFIL